MIKIGIIGLYDKGNGHPFSFSSIINGYSVKGYKKSNYHNILKYLQKKKIKDFGIKNTQVTHAWTQNYKTTKILCEASKIKYCLKDYKSMIDEIDALIIARDDKHYEISKEFLKRNIPVFIDKPLSIDHKELNFFLKYMNKGLLMSSSGLRFSPEVKKIKKILIKLGNIKFIIANISNDWRRYGVHMLEVIEELNFLDIKKFEKIKSKSISYNLINKENVNIIINCLGSNKPILNLSFFGTKGKYSIDFKDNFSAFKNMLIKFVKMVETKKIVLSPKKTINIMQILKKAETLS